MRISPLMVSVWSLFLNFVLIKLTFKNMRSHEAFENGSAKTFKGKHFQVPKIYFHFGDFSNCLNSPKTHHWWGVYSLEENFNGTFVTIGHKLSVQGMCFLSPDFVVQISRELQESWWDIAIDWWRHCVRWIIAKIEPFPHFLT